ncbi:MAG: relaxase/mobilization nuclease domain-containing protein [Clostridiales bacterium]|nr:relaxase/mobilization nuclease domain-containing protein [Clostridiales bacterium]
MAITKILNIKESEGRNPASHLKNALEYIQNPDKTEECVLVGGINCLPDTAFEQMEETKNIFHKTGKRQGYHVIISFSPEEKVTAEQAMYVLEHFAKAVLGDDYEAVYAVHTDREHMHGHLIWNSVSMTTGKKYNSPKSNWKNHLQPITNKYCDELGLAIMPAEYSRNPKNISRDKWEREMSMKEIILRDAKMCAYAAGNVEHFKYLMKRLGYVFKKDAWMEVQAPGFRYYHKLAKLDEMFSEDMLRHHVDMPWMVKPYFYSSDIRGLHRAKLSSFQKKFYAKLYRLRIVEQKRFAVGGAKYTEDLKRFHQLQDEYLLIVNNDIKSVVDLVDFINEQEEKIQQIEDRQHEIYRESSSRKRSIKNEEQYREYQIWHVEVQEELDELKQEKREIKRQIQLADDIIKEDLYTAYYAVSGKEEIVADRDVEIPGMEEDMLDEITIEAVVEPYTNVEVMNPNNNQNDTSVMPDIRNVSDVNTARMDKDITDVTDKGEYVEIRETEPVDKADWIVRRISELGGYENVSNSVKADIFGFDIADVSGSIRLFSDVMKKLGMKLDGDELYEEFQRIYDESIDRDAGKDKAEDKMWNRGRGR